MLENLGLGILFIVVLIIGVYFALMTLIATLSPGLILEKLISQLDRKFPFLEHKPNVRLSIIVILSILGILTSYYIFKFAIQSLNGTWEFLVVLLLLPAIIKFINFILRK
jgi:hypothetical protein